MSAFQDWLATRQPFDYWHQAAVPPDFAQQALAVFEQARQARKLPLRHVVWHITNRCNLRCLHCGVRGGELRYRDLSLDDFARALPQMLRLGLSHVTLSGGEPLVRKDLFDIIAVLKLCRLQVAMVSNGHNFERFEAQFRDHPLDSLSLSLDGLADSHDQIRAWPGSFEQVMRAIELAVAWGIPLVNVNTCVSPQNIGQMTELRDRLFGLGIQHWTLRPITESGRASEHAFGLNTAQMQQLLDFVEVSLEAGFDISLAGMGFLAERDPILNMAPYISTAGWDSFYILPNGDIKGFNEAHLPLEGNLLHDDLIELWQTGFGYYRQAQLDSACPTCKWLSRCGGGNIPEAETGVRCLPLLLANAG